MAIGLTSLLARAPNAGGSDYIVNASNFLVGNYTLLSSGVYIQSGSIVLQLCALSSRATEVPSTWQVTFGTVNIPITFCALMGVRDDGPDSKALVFNVSTTPFICPSGEPSEVVVNDFNPISAAVPIACPSAGPQIPQELRGTGKADARILPVPLPLPIPANYLVADTTIAARSLQASFLEGALFASLCPVAVSDLPPNTLNASHPPLVAGAQVVFGEASRAPEFETCTWMAREASGALLVTATFPGEPCPTNFTNNVTVTGFYPAVSGAASAAVHGLVLVATLLAAVAQLSSSSSSWLS